MAILSLLSLFSIISYVLADCSSGDYGNFLSCLNVKINKEWTDLDTQGQSKIGIDEKRFQACYKAQNCNFNLPFGGDFTDLLDPNLKNLAGHIRDFWDKAPRAMQACILLDARDKFFGQIEACVNKTVPSFKLPDPLPGLPMPPKAMYDSKRDLLIKYVSDRITALLGLQHCESTRITIARCMKKDVDDSLGQCIKNGLCSNPSCKSNFPQVCSLVSTCIPKTLKEVEKKISTFQEKDKNKILGFLGDCEKRAQEADDPGYKYSRTTVLQIYNDVVKIGPQLSTSFKSLIKDLVEAYFSGEGLCTSGCN